MAVTDQSGHRKAGKRDAHRGRAATDPSADDLLCVIDRYQARGNMLAQFGSVLTEEEQENAKAEVLSYKF